MVRPEFNRYMNANEFNKYYWYKTELQEICRRYHLPTYGTKYELTLYITALLEGKAVDQIKPVRISRRSKKRLNASDITVSTPILDSGFSLNNEARKFFCRYYDLDKFSFTKSMGIKMREIEKSNDKKATVQDLIQAYENKESSYQSRSEEEKTYQWNNFVKDFRQDPNSTNFKSPMKVAAILWKHVKNSDSDKTYNMNLIRQHYDEIKSYLKE
ncbi:putative cytosolic protein [Fructobacillus fructosus]|nr:putative cytosolic protein [Fructobacillus fructosus]